jgi:hypothetical protein
LIRAATSDDYPNPGFLPDGQVVGLKMIIDKALAEAGVKK